MFKRVHWKPLAVIATVLLLDVVAAYRLGTRAAKRWEFVSPVDAVSGYRCRFTLPSSWMQPVSQPPIHMVEDDSDTPVFSFFSTLSPTEEWISKHLWKDWANPIKIDFTASTHLGSTGYCPIVKGYPEYAISNVDHIISHRHLTIDGYPATRVTFEMIASPTIYSEFLLVYVPDHAMVYMVGGVEPKSDYDALDHEMQGIISSFHVEKVVSAGGKR